MTMKHSSITNSIMTNTLNTVHLDDFCTWVLILKSPLIWSHFFWDTTKWIQTEAKPYDIWLTVWNVRLARSVCMRSLGRVVGGCCEMGWSVFWVSVWSRGEQWGWSGPVYPRSAATWLWSSKLTTRMPSCSLCWLKPIRYFVKLCRILFLLRGMSPCSYCPLFGWQVDAGGATALVHKERDSLFLYRKIHNYPVASFLWWWGCTASINLSSTEGAVAVWTYQLEKRNIFVYMSWNSQLNKQIERIKFFTLTLHQRKST